MTDPNGHNAPHGGGADSEATVVQPTRQMAAGQGGGSRADRIMGRHEGGSQTGSGGSAGGAQPDGHQSYHAAPQEGHPQQERTRPGDTGKKAAAGGGLAAGAGVLADKLRGRKSDHTSQNHSESLASAVPRPAKDPAGGTSAGPTPVKKLGEARRTRKARLRLSQVDPWSVMKTAFLFSVAAGIVLWVATGTVWGVIGSSGLFDSLNQLIGEIIQTPGDTTPFRIQDYVNTNKVMGTAALIAVVDVVIFTALATLGAFLYNLASAMIGGLEVTLAED